MGLFTNPRSGFQLADFRHMIKTSLQRSHLLKSAPVLMTQKEQLSKVSQFIFNPDSGVMSQSTLVKLPDHFLLVCQSYKHAFSGADLGGVKGVLTPPFSQKKRKKNREVSVA